MGSYFTAEFFKGNRQKLLEKSNSELIVVTANGLLQRNSDVNYPFQQDRSFWYLTGIDDPDVVLVIGNGQPCLIVPEQSHIKDIFDGSIENTDLIKRSGITKVYSQKNGWKHLITLVKNSKSVSTLQTCPGYVKGIGMYTNPARSRLVKRLKSYNSQIAIHDIRPYLAELRVIKQVEEINTIQKAVDITCKSFIEIQKAIDDFKFEYEIDAQLLSGFRRNSAIPAYENIVASGKNACTLHYISNNDRIKSGSLVLIDAGAQCENYAADITRTFTTSGSTKRQYAVIDAVEEALKFGISQLKPGVSFKECEGEVRQFIGEKLLELGLISENSKEAIQKYYPHSPHYLGLDVHDVGNYDWPLKAGMVLTLEPGIYIPEENIGVRIEEDILITENSAVVLSQKLPTTF